MIHTTGPWILSQHNKPGNGWVVSAGWRTITQVDEIGNIKEAKANAQLIAAAPDLLEALLICRNSLAFGGAIQHPSDQIAWDKATAAIDKATK